VLHIYIYIYIYNISHLRVKYVSTAKARCSTDQRSMATEMLLSLARRALKDKFPTPTVPLTTVLQNLQVFLPAILWPSTIASYFHSTSQKMLHMQCGDIDPDITIYCLEPFTFFFDMSFGFYEPVGKVAGYEPDDGCLITYRPNICCFLFTLELTQNPVQYSLEVREPPCVGLQNSGNHQFLYCCFDLPWPIPTN